MSTPGAGDVERILADLQERAKELNCLYQAEEVLRQDQRPLREVLEELLHTLPPGWLYPDLCRARVVIDGLLLPPGAAGERKWVQSAPLSAGGQPVGRLDVFYVGCLARAEENPFLPQEQKLLETIAGRLSEALTRRRVAEPAEPTPEKKAEEWWSFLDFMGWTQPRLLIWIGRKMLTHLLWNGVPEARALLRRNVPVSDEDEAALRERNLPLKHAQAQPHQDFVHDCFQLAAVHLSRDEILRLIQQWINDEKSSFLVAVLENAESTLADIDNALERHRHTEISEGDLSEAVRRGLRVSLIRRILSEDLSFLRISKRHLRLEDFHELLGQIIIPPRSRGRLGGKGSGLALAHQILRKAAADHPELGEIAVPRTWYLPSDVLLQFIHHNDLGDVYSWKYREVEEIRQQYPHIIQAFKSGRFPPEVVHSISAVLDQMGRRPLIVRSSSLLEDRSGSAFSGKYKSLFLANQGPKSERLAALLDAIAEIYASVFGPDPIQYRVERGLLDVNEEMAILIQEVVGRRIGPYFLPAFAGVAFSRNEFRWTPRIRRQDGLMRMVPGLGTRAVDRVGDDFPVLVAPGQPQLRVNQSPDEIARYSPRYVDALDLEERSFVTLPVQELLEKHGDEIPSLGRMVSIHEGNQIRPLVGLWTRPEPPRYVVTFDGLLKGTPFVEQIRSALHCLEESLETPVDIEFAHDGKRLHLLQCRPQSSRLEGRPAPIPRDLPPDRLLFTANRHISNGWVPDLQYVVYVDPERYAALATADELKQVGRAVGRINKVLPKRRFLLMGPGRWGSRGDLRLGVSVTYSDINNCAVLAEVAHRKGDYVPDLSFGTHFFQDLVEAEIRYLPLYPDDPEVAFRETYFRQAPDIFEDIAPDFAHLVGVVRVIDVPAASGGQVLRILLNADLEEAAGVLVQPGRETGGEVEMRRHDEDQQSDAWRWRLRIAQELGRSLDGERFGVKGLYLCGSTKNGTAGPQSDIDLIVHVTGDPARLRDLQLWMGGWQSSLRRIHRLRTGYDVEQLLDLHYVTDEDIDRGESFAVRIGAVTDAARPLPLKRVAG